MTPEERATLHEYRRDIRTAYLAMGRAIERRCQAADRKTLSSEPAFRGSLDFDLFHAAFSSISGLLHSVEANAEALGAPRFSWDQMIPDLDPVEETPPGARTVDQELAPADLVALVEEIPGNPPGALLVDQELAPVEELPEGNPDVEELPEGNPDVEELPNLDQVVRRVVKEIVDQVVEAPFDPVQDAIDTEAAFVAALVDNFGDLEDPSADDVPIFLGEGNPLAELDAIGAVLDAFHIASKATPP